jgi:lipopolysaccharide assembly protein A
MSVVRWIVGATIFLGLLYFSLDNAETVTLRFFRVAQWQAPLVFVVFVAFASGVALGLIAGAFRASRLKRQIARMRREHRRDVPVPAPHGAAPPPRDTPPLDAL